MNLKTTFTLAQIADLTAIVTNGPAKRAANLDVGVERFTKAAAKAGLGSPNAYLTMKSFEVARVALVADMEAIDAANVMKGAKVTVTERGPVTVAATNADGIAVSDMPPVPSFLKRTGSAEEKATVAAAFEAAAEKRRAASPQPASLGAAATPREAKATAKRTPSSTKRRTTPKVSRPTPRATDGKSKTDIIAGLLQRAKGTTTKDILEATGWPSVSVPAMAKAAGLALRKEKNAGEPTRYFGTPEKGAAKAAAAEHTRGQVRRGRAA